MEHMRKDGAPAKNNNNSNQESGVYNYYSEAAGDHPMSEGPENEP